MELNHNRCPKLGVMCATVASYVAITSEVRSSEFLQILHLSSPLPPPSQARDALSAENAELHAKLAEANAKIQQLQAHISQIRQHTIGFILEQMNTLNPQHSSTEV